ncbi:MAG: GNAT family N-acetyltransferase [Candidatus Gottesmanbacteria bacterium]|nr:GNAT family N-acetyltransferase [Candidatus Gottesmanbacteria bacterium]
MSTTYKQIKTIQEFIGAIRLRVDVFIKEQQCAPGWEPDEEDKVSEHFIALVDRKIVGTARVRRPNPEEIKIERMAIDKGFRGKGVGDGLLRYVIKQTMRSKPKRIWMQAQTHAQAFYEKCGFHAVSKPYDLYGIEHVDMELMVLDKK